MKIFLVGFMGSGKTNIGRLLAEPIGYNFVDTDSYIEMKNGMTVSEIFAQHGEAAFRNMERDVLLEMQKHDFVVVATGGGLPCFKDNMDMMLADGRVVYLKTFPQSLVSRLMRSPTERPLIKGKTERELTQYVSEKLAIREKYYHRAHFIVQTETLSLDKLLQLLNLKKF